MQEPPSHDETSFSSPIPEASYVQLSRYVDRVLPHEELIALELQLETDPDLRAELSRLQALKGHLGRIGGLLLSEDGLAENVQQTPCLWNAIAERLTQVEEPSELSLDAAMLSAYLDNEFLIVSKAEQLSKVAIEEKLHSDPAACEQLARFRHLSEAIRNLTYRQEESPVLPNGDLYPANEMTQAVMAAFTAEGVAESNLSALSQDDVTLLSAMLDEELKPQDMILAHRLIECDSIAQLTVRDFSRLSSAIQNAIPVWEGMVAAVDTQALMERVKEALTENAKTEPVSLEQRRKESLRAFWLAAPMIAASVLLVVSWPGLSMEQMLGNSMPRSSGVGQPVSDTQQVASLPRYLHRGLGKEALSERLSETESIPSFSDHLSRETSAHPGYRTVAPPSHPVIDPAVKQMATRRRSGVTDGRVSVSRGPSSEAYLFKALDEKSSDDDLTTILN